MICLNESELEDAMLQMNLREQLQTLELVSKYKDSFDPISISDEVIARKEFFKCMHGYLEDCIIQKYGCSIKAITTDAKQKEFRNIVSIS